MMTGVGTLHFLCGKLAAGKSTVARELAAHHTALLLVEDDLLAALFPRQIDDVASYARYAARVRSAIFEPVRALLGHGMSVVLDFPGNTREQRRWFRRLFEAGRADHRLHFVVATDELCKEQLRLRSRDAAPGSAFVSEEDFDAINRYFEAPQDCEEFTVVTHQRC